MMAKTVDYVTGDAELDAALKRLDNSARRKLVKRAIARGLKPVAAETIAKAPRRTGLLAKAIRIKVTNQLNGKVFVDPSVFSVSGTVVKFKFERGVTAADKRQRIKNWLQSQRDAGRRVQRPARYAAVVEFGRRAGISERTRRKISASPARPFMRPAMDAARERVLSEIADEIRKNLAELRI